MTKTVHFNNIPEIIVYDNSSMDSYSSMDSNSLIENHEISMLNVKIKKKFIDLNKWMKKNLTMSMKKLKMIMK